MKHQSCRALYRYWDSLRDGALAPARSAVEPAAISEHLRDTFILEAEGGEYRYRLAGTRTCALLGQELRGTSFLDVWSPEDRDQMENLLFGVAKEGSGVIAGVIAIGRRDDTVALELLLLPLVQQGPDFDRILGALMPMHLPYWLGIEPLRSLSLSSARQLRSRDASILSHLDPQPMLAAVAAATNEPESRRNRFVVVEGGKS